MNLESGPWYGAGAWLIHRKKLEALVENAISVSATQKQRRSLILSDLTVEIASTRNLCSVRRFNSQQLPLIPLFRYGSPKAGSLRVEPNRSGSLHPEPQPKGGWRNRKTITDKQLQTTTWTRCGWERDEFVYVKGKMRNNVVA